MATATANENYVNGFLKLMKAKLKTSFCDIYLNFLDDKNEMIIKSKCHLIHEGA